ncbi:hypothetical protein LCGC14_1342060 [marine sediment metagenome]|uniref:Uncharacterized protein n=1 Tax=marine sediment metagenome TaxID=412755 RepID=A0A0F9KE38_9ZZZZ
MDKFWKVQGEGLAHNVKRFTDIGSAKLEAIRLASQHPGVKVVMLASLGHYIKEAVTWTPQQLTK